MLIPRRSRCQESLGLTTACKRSRHEETPSFHSRARAGNLSPPGGTRCIVEDLEVPRKVRHAFPGVPESFPGVPESFPGIPESFPGVPEGFPETRKAFWDVPEGFPGIPGAFPEVPE